MSGSSRIFSIIHAEHIEQSTFQLVGTGKFKTPRCNDMTIPIVLTPEMRVNSIESFKEKIVISCSTKFKNSFRGMSEWLASLNDTLTCNTIVAHGDVFLMKFKVSSLQELHITDMHGVILSTAEEIMSLTGKDIVCAIELPCLWQSDTQYGLAMNLIEAKILTSAPCLISDDLEDIYADRHTIALDIQPAYIPFEE